MNKRTQIVKAVQRIDADLQEVISYHSDQLGVRKLAREIGVSPTTVSLINNGHIPDFTTLRKISDWLANQ